ncbi:MAG: peptide chain release factor N(5)-glutamine methyltransferase [Jatrophihabitans sp.]
MTAVRTLLAEAAARLNAAGIATPRVDAELMLAAALHVSRSRLLTVEDVSPPAAREYEQWVQRRESRVPLQHITGTAPFRHIELAVGDGVFVPRPETELLVDAVLPHLRGIDAPLVVDLCAGSGALALAVADEVPAARVVAVECSLNAIRWLTVNSVDTEVEVVHGDVRAPTVLAELNGRVDAVVCNPPYVPWTTDVAAEVRADPPEAVFAGADGLELIPAIIDCAARLLRPGGVLAMEHDDAHGDAVPALLVSDGRWTSIAARSDLSHRPRYVVAQAR